jgi:hypothetical protein
MQNCESGFESFESEIPKHENMNVRVSQEEILVPYTYYLFHCSLITFSDLDPPTPPPIPEAVLQQLEMLQQNFRQWVTNISLHALRLGLISVECAVDRFLTQSPVSKAASN